MVRSGWLSKLRAFELTPLSQVASGPELAAAVTNAGGLGVIGGFGYTPKYLQQQLTELKEGLRDKGAPFGVDLLLPAVGELRRTCSSFGCETISFRKLIGDAGKVETRERRTRTVRNSAWLRFAAPDSLSRQTREENWQSLSI